MILVGGGTPLSEARLEEKRRVLRRALKKEYMNQRFNPEMYPSGRRVFDTAFMRWNALQNSSDILVSCLLYRSFKVIVISLFCFKGQEEYWQCFEICGFIHPACGSHDYVYQQEATKFRRKMPCG